MLISCFLDDSGKEGQQTNPFVVMAGYLADQSAWVSLWEKWAQLLLKHGISSIHMKNIIPLEGEYKDLGWDIPKRDAVVSDFIEVINQARMVGIGIAVEVAVWRQHKRNNPDIVFGTIQEFCFQRILRKVIDRLSATGLEGKVELWFDRDPEFSASRIHLFNWVLQHDPRARNLLAAISFADPNFYPGLQCADLLAWEARKELVQRAEGHKSTRRWRELFAAMPDYHLDYMSELWDEAEFKEYHVQAMDALRRGHYASSSEAWRGLRA